ncbi:Alpha/Beta hydrolase protein [Xylogone sp. PMI_703]|nr:Alpha/Beta hydrolase protein [Xylogone sp. PMI_703]
MRLPGICFSLFTSVLAFPSAPLQKVFSPSLVSNNDHISPQLFASLEELSRIVDISYCVGTTGIYKPFVCASRCDEFPDFELIDSFNTGPLMSDSCGYMAMDHRRRRIIVAFRGTYSIANTIADLSTIPQEYVPYPGDPEDGDGDETTKEKKEQPKCTNCTVHMGFWTSWRNTRDFIVPTLKKIRKTHPGFELHLVGHSLGGAVAALAGLEFELQGWNPIVTTFGEPKLGNAGLRNYIDAVFNITRAASTPGVVLDEAGRYRRVTHVDDPVPLLPLHEWGFRPHAGEVYISKGSLQPSTNDLHLCVGDEDPDCIAGAEAGGGWMHFMEELGFLDDAAAYDAETLVEARHSDDDEWVVNEKIELRKRWGIPIPARYKIWQLLFAHRDYFWRLGLCIKGGDPFDWGRERYNVSMEDLR